MVELNEVSTVTNVFLGFACNLNCLFAYKNLYNIFCSQSFESCLGGLRRENTSEDLSRKQVGQARNFV